MRDGEGSRFETMGLPKRQGEIFVERDHLYVSVLMLSSCCFCNVVSCLCLDCGEGVGVLVFFR